MAAMPSRPVAADVSHLPLRGACVIVTRPSEGAAPLLRRVRALGGTPLRLPGIALRPAADAPALRQALRAAQTAALAVFISPAAVRHAWRVLPTLRFSRSTRVAAVGAGTARALRRRGLTEVCVPQGAQDSTGLLADPALRGLRGAAVAVIGAPGGRDLLVPTLRRRGARVQRIDIYRRVAPRWTRRHLAALELAPRPWLLLVSSAEALAHLATALPPGLVLALRRAECVVSSARLAGLAAQHGFTRVHVAASALAADLLTAAAAALARHRL